MKKGIMIQGTMSGAGKSMLVTALCRYYKRKGIKVCPFKSQNMALNSFVTPEGAEIGRAQAAQAEAAGIFPEARMNPILLKPNSNVGSQVIFMGEVLGNYPAAEYYEMKKDLLPKVVEAYHSLEEEYELILTEGAGSPAEINLRDNDLVNMGLAEALDLPVILVADIDPGGVFAQIYGTLALLSEAERRRVKAYVINRFRGDEALLMPGINQLNERLRELPGCEEIRCLGILPYEKLELDPEDSLSHLWKKKSHNRSLDIAIVRLPHISNVTDFLPLEDQPALGYRFVEKTEEMAHPDLIVLPGTKNTMQDLHWLKESGLSDCIIKLNQREDTLVLGVCGGYQMLGVEVQDPLGVEVPESDDQRENPSCETKSEYSRIEKGLGLLPITTILEKEKRTCTVDDVCDMGALGKLPLQGYEIHMGKSDPPLRECCRDNVFGTYVHGLFDNGLLTAAFVNYLSKGTITPAQAVSRMEKKMEIYHQLADMVEEHLDMEFLETLREKNE